MGFDHVVRSQGEDQATKFVEVEALKVRDSVGGIVLHHIEDGASVEADAVFARQKDFVGFEHSGSEFFAVDGF